jgi:eukaryotic-like serine/threonine-protein kinase
VNRCAVAVKLLPLGVVAAPESPRRFENEARSAAALGHPNIVTVHDSGEHRGVPFIVMAATPEHTLAEGRRTSHPHPKRREG